MAPRRESLNNEVEDGMLDSVPGLAEDTGGDEFDTVEGGDEVGAEPQQQQTAQDPTDLRQQDEGQVKYDQAGNVVDARGNIVAPAGRGRRLDEQNRRYRGLLEAKDRELQQLKATQGESQFLNGAPAKLGLNNDETAAALDMMALFK
jgi:hypothetical protein